MSGPSVQIVNSTIHSDAPREYLSARWYAVQTGANQERQVVCHLRDRGIESFLPVYEELRRRTDRKVVVQVPLFSCYLFVHIALCDRLQVLEVPRVARLVTFGHIPMPVPDRDINALKAGLMRDRRIMPHPYLQIGRRVRVGSGAFSGLEGVLLRRKGSLRVVVAIEAISRSFSVEIDERELQPSFVTTGNRKPITGLPNSCGHAVAANLTPRGLSN